MFALVHDIEPSYRTEYSGIILKLELRENERGRGH